MIWCPTTFFADSRAPHFVRGANKDGKAGINPSAPSHHLAYLKTSSLPNRAMDSIHQPFHLTTLEQLPSLLLLLDRSLATAWCYPLEGLCIKCGVVGEMEMGAMFYHKAASMSLSTAMETGVFQTKPTLTSSSCNARPPRLVHSSQLIQPYSLLCQSIGAFDSCRIQ